MKACYNDLETLCPDMAKERHSQKNGSMRPGDVLAFFIKRCGRYAKKDIYVKPLLTHVKESRLRAVRCVREYLHPGTRYTDEKQIGFEEDCLQK